MSGTPPCFGLLFDATESACGSCLVRDRCNRLQQAGGPGANLERQPAGGTQQNLPEDKKLLILMVCAKFGIPTTYKEKRGAKQEYTVTPENAGSFFNLDFLVTTKEALRKMLESD